MERRSLLRKLLSLGSRNLTRLAKDNWLASSSESDLRTICDVLSDFYDRKLDISETLRQGASWLARYALSPLNREPYRFLATPSQLGPIGDYQIARVGRREFLIVSGIVMAAAVAGTLYYVNPALRNLLNVTTTTTTTTTATKTATSTAIRTTTTTRTTTERVTTCTYRMTVSTTWYNRREHKGQGYEIHFKTARQGLTKEVRRELVSEGAAYFQETVYEECGLWIPRRKLRIGFEQEEPAESVRNEVTVSARSMEYQAGHWRSTPMPTEVLSYANKA